MVKSEKLQTHVFDFPESAWVEIVENTVISSNLSGIEEQKIRKNPVARLLAALPYYAGCKNPDQLAALKLGMYVAGMRNPAMFAHRENQTVRERIEPGVLCPSGDPEIIEIATSFLELISLNDHIHDFEEDMKTGHPNPIGTNMLFHYARRDQLVYEIENVYNQDVVQRMMQVVNPMMAWWDTGVFGV